jgi:hypothetical protein
MLNEMAAGPPSTGLAAARPGSSRPGLAAAAASRADRPPQPVRAASARSQTNVALAAGEGSRPIEAGERPPSCEDPIGRRMPRLLLVASPGGHLSQLYALDRFWRKYQRTWVTSRSLHSESLLSSEIVVEGFFPTNRNVINLFRNLLLAYKVLAATPFDMVVSTGAGVAVPFFVIARLFGVTSVYIESVSRQRSLSLTGQLVYYLATEVLVQWPEMCARFRRAKFKGRVL